MATSTEPQSNLACPFCDSGISVGQTTETFYWECSDCSALGIGFPNRTRLRLALQQQ